MNKIIITLSLLLCTTLTKAQEFSYGVILGGDLYLSANNSYRSRFENAEGSLVANYGVYLEYGINKNIGIKTELYFNNKVVNFEQFIEGIGLVRAASNHKLSFFEIAPNLKFDFGQEYRKGFYMLFGPKFSFMTAATYEGADAINLFNKSRVGLQLGVGTRIKKIIDFEIKLDGENTPFFEVEDRASNFINVYFTVGVDLERLIRKK